MKPVVVNCEADVELTATAKRYACARPELARDFLHAFRLAKEAIAKQPDRFPFLEKPVRRVRIPGFLHVLAIMHDSREPGYWKSRLN